MIPIDETRARQLLGVVEGATRAEIEYAYAARMYGHDGCTCEAKRRWTIAVELLIPRQQELL